MNLYAPTKAREVPRKLNAGVASRLRTLLEAKQSFAYVRLNTQTPCPPRGAVQPLSKAVDGSKIVEVVWPTLWLPPRQ
jgi:hypothetical protein